jgi:hypothetical protein
MRPRALQPDLQRQVVMVVDVPARVIEVVGAKVVPGVGIEAHIGAGLAAHGASARTQRRNFTDRDLRKRRRSGWPVTELNTADGERQLHTR